MSAAAPHGPTSLHRMVDHDEVIDRLDRYQQPSLHDSEMLRRWRDVLETLGLSSTDVAVDRLLARVQTPRAKTDDTDLVTAPLDTHRDTWASNMSEQVNWWAPVYSVDEGATMEVYPVLFSTSVANTSATFDIVKLRRQPADSTRVAPRPLEPTADAASFRVLIEPGDLLAFSGAHMHRSVPNTTNAPATRSTPGPSGFPTRWRAAERRTPTAWRPGRSPGLVPTPGRRCPAARTAGLGGNSSDLVPRRETFAMFRRLPARRPSPVSAIRGIIEADSSVVVDGTA